MAHHFPPHMQRVVDEKAELDSKLTKLTAFIGTPVFEQLKPNDKELLRLQAVTMSSYSDILEARINNFLGEDHAA